MVKFKNIRTSIAVSIILIFMSCESDPASEKNWEDLLDNLPVNDYELFVDSLTKIQHDITIEIDDYAQYHCDVDFEEYMKYFDKLTVDPNWIIESFCLRGVGRSYIVAFENQSVRSTVFTKATNVYQEDDTVIVYLDYNILQKYQDSIHYTTAIHVENSLMGWFQFMTFYIIGDIYSLFGQANYYHRDIVCSKHQIVKLIQSTSYDYYYDNLYLIKNEVLAIDFTPEIEITDDLVTVRLVIFDPWEGFTEKKYSITTGWPHKVKSSESKVLLEYNCMIDF